MLDARLRLAQARVAELEAQYASEFVADRAKAEIAREKLEASAPRSLSRARRPRT